MLRTTSASVIHLDDRFDQTFYRKQLREKKVNNEQKTPETYPAAMRRGTVFGSQLPQQPCRGFGCVDKILSRPIHGLIPDDISAVLAHCDIGTSRSATGSFGIIIYCSIDTTTMKYTRGRCPGGRIR